VRYAGYAVDSVRTPLGLALIIYVPALTIITDEFRRLVRYYKKQIYRAPWRRPHAGQLDVRKVAVAAHTVLAVVLAGMFAWPAHAALQAKTSLQQSSITATATAPLAHVMLRSLDFECSLDNTGAENRLPGIVLYNPTAADIQTGGWYLQNSKGRLLTFRPGTVFDARDTYDIESDLKQGIIYTGDYLVLFDNAGKLMDGISWGTDTTYLNQALPGAQDGTRFRRVPLLADTDQAADWAVSLEQCIGIRRE
jgi:hypothetical protein